MKSVMNKWEERNNDDKEEELEFGTEEGGEIKILGSWVSSEVDVRNRIRRASGLWWRMIGWLKGSRMSKKCQARVVETCVESSLIGGGGERGRGAVRGRVAWCPGCQRWLSATNVARHQERCRLVWDPGGGRQVPDGDRLPEMKWKMDHKSESCPLVGYMNKLCKLLVANHITVSASIAALCS